MTRPSRDDQNSLGGKVLNFIAAGRLCRTGQDAFIRDLRRFGHEKLAEAAEKSMTCGQTEKQGSAREKNP